MQKIGLVFSGGGGKGPYQVGVWRAMEQLGLAKDIHAVSGTSVGALNAALFAQNDLKNAEKAWLSMSPSDILHIDIEQILKFLTSKGLLPHRVPSLLATLAMHGVFSRKGLLRIITEYLDEEQIKRLAIPFYACATKLPLLDATYFSLQEYSKKEVESILLASSAIPLIFPIETVGSASYYDGFLTDNTPIKPLYDEGCDIIVVIMLSRDDILPINDFPNSNIIPIYPQNDLGKSLNFNNIPEKMQNGFDDAIKTLSPAFELMEVNYQYSVELKNYERQNQEYLQLCSEREQAVIVSKSSQENLITELEKCLK